MEQAFHYYETSRFNVLKPDLFSRPKRSLLYLKRKLMYMQKEMYVVQAP